MTPKQLEALITHYYDFCETGTRIMKNNPLHSGDIKDEVYHGVINSFLSSLSNYLLLVYDDLKADESLLFAKSNTNKVLLRVTIEAVLLLDIFKRHPEYIENYYSTYVSDKKRMAALFDNQEYDEKYLRRFEWLPKIKRHRPSSLVDLLNYIDWEDAEQKEFYEIIIRNLDAFIHPSFYLGRSVETQAITNIDVISPIFIEGGIVYELCDNFIDLVNDYNPELAKSLKSCLASRELTNALSIKYADNHRNLPQDIGPVCYALSNISNLLKFDKEPSYLQRNIAYLTTDLAPRFEDLLQAYFTGNKFLFEIQLRTIMESLSMMHILLKEDEARNYVFYLHQQIKGYEANKTALELLDKYGINTSNVHLDDMNQSLVDIIADYYQKVHKVEIAKKDILRLNGWALYLKDTNNQTVPNAVDIINNMLNDLFKKEAGELLATVFEESNTYTHVTLYAFLDDNAKIEPKYVIYINHALHNILRGFISIPNFLNLNGQEKEELSQQLLLTFNRLNAAALNQI